AGLEADGQHQAADDFDDDGRPDQDAGHSEHFPIADIELDGREFLEARQDEDQRQQDAADGGKVGFERIHDGVSVLRLRWPDIAADTLNEKPAQTQRIVHSNSTNGGVPPLRRPGLDPEPSTHQSLGISRVAAVYWIPALRPG